MDDKTDKPQNASDDLFDSSFADEDIDAEIIDEFPDDEWDDTFDDSSIEPAEGGETEKQAPPRRSFLRGKMLYLVVGLFVVIAGAVLFLQGSGKKDSAFPEAQDTPIQIDELADTSDLPPMPAPINPADETSQSAADGVPDVAVIEDPALDVPKVPAVPPDSRLSQVDMNPPIPVPAPEIVAESAPAETLAATPPLSALDNTAALATLAAEKDLEAASKLNTARKEWEAQFNAMQADLAKKLETAEAKLKDTQAKTKDSESKIKSLTNENQSLKAQLKTLKETPKPKPAPPPPPPTPKEQTKPATTAPLPENTNWILRSAQPGRALVSQPGTDIMKSIKIGDTVPGLGRITSIDIENGVWVVHGTESRISR